MSYLTVSPSIRKLLTINFTKNKILRLLQSLFTNPPHAVRSNILSSLDPLDPLICSSGDTMPSALPWHCLSCNLGCTPRASGRSVVQIPSRTDTSGTCVLRTPRLFYGIVSIYLLFLCYGTVPFMA